MSGKQIAPKEFQKLGKIANGRDNFIAFLSESIGSEVKNNTIDFSHNKEIMDKLHEKEHNI